MSGQLSQPSSLGLLPFHISTGVLPGAWLSVSVSVLFKLYLCVGCKAFHKSHTCAGEDGNCRTHISDPLFSTCKSVTVPQKECCFRCSYLGEITAEHTCHTAIASSFLFIPHAGQEGEKKQQKEEQSLLAVRRVGEGILNGNHLGYLPWFALGD